MVTKRAREVGRRHRGILAGLMLAALALLLVTAGQVLLFRLPPPDEASGGQLARWLVLRDVQREPWETRVALVGRLERELQQELAEGKSGFWLKWAPRKRLADNAEHLKYVWFASRVEQYGQCDPQQRGDFLDKQIATLMRWTAIDLSSATGQPQQSEGDSQPAVVGFFEQIEGWIQQANGQQQRQQMARAVRDAVIHWLATEDLNEQPVETRQALAERVVDQLVHADLPEQLGQQDGQQRRLLLANGQLLLHAWLDARVEEFFALPVAQRRAFIDQQIVRLFDSGALQRIAALTSAEPADAPSPGASPLAAWLTLVDQWIERAEPDDRDRLRQLVGSVQQRLLWRQLQGLF